MYSISKGVPTGSSKLFNFIDPLAYNENWFRRCNHRENSETFSTNTSLLTSTRLVKSARWVILSNTIVAYWPFSVGSSVSDGQQEIQKFLNFTYPTCGLFLTCIYLILNVAYVIYYFLFIFHKSLYSAFDLVLMTFWNLLIVVGVTLHRLYGLVKLSQFPAFWDKILNIIDQCSNLNGEEAIELALIQVKRYTLKWLVIFTVLGLSGWIVVLIALFEQPEFGLDALPFAYLQAVVYMHNSSSLLLIYFIKIITIGFFTCKDKLNQLSFALQPSGDGFQNKRDLFKLATTIPILGGIFDLVDQLENAVGSFNSLFSFSLACETIFGYLLILFCAYFLHESPYTGFLPTVGMFLPILVYSTCLVRLCVTASKMGVECEEMIKSFQRLSLSSISQDDSYKIQLLVTRLAAMPPGIKVGQLLQIRESLLVSILNAFATYFIVLVQMKQLNKSIQESEMTHTTGELSSAE